MAHGALSPALLGQVLLRLEAVSRKFPATPPVAALRRVSFTVAQGEVVAIVGRSGSGKSTLLNVLGLLDEPSEGTYLIDSLPVETLSDSERTRLRSEFFGFVFQQSFLLARYNAQENVELALRPQRVSPRRRREMAATALAQVGLSHRRTAMPQTMSGGERQRVAIARAVAQRPKAILCDEPTGNLDERTASEVQALLLGLATNGTTVILVTHDLAVARALPRILSVRDGALSEGLDPGLLVGGAQT